MKKQVITTPFLARFNKYDCMRYKHIAQKPYCCVPACVQMILERRDLRLLTQPTIAYDLGVALPPNQRKLLPKSYNVPRPKSGWGTRINKSKYSLGSFFKGRKYPLREEYHSAKSFASIRSFRKFLLDNVNENDMLVCFNYPMLYELEGSWGHASLVVGVGDSYVTLRDPDAKQTKLRRVELGKFYLSLKNHPGGGVWVVKSL